MTAEPERGAETPRDLERVLDAGMQRARQNALESLQRVHTAPSVAIERLAHAVLDLVTGLAALDSLTDAEEAAGSALWVDPEHMELVSEHRDQIDALKLAFGDARIEIPGMVRPLDADVPGALHGTPGVVRLAEAGDTKAAQLEAAINGYAQATMMQRAAKNEAGLSMFMVEMMAETFGNPEFHPGAEYLAAMTAAVYRLEGVLLRRRGLAPAGIVPGEGITGHRRMAREVSGVLRAVFNALSLTTLKPHEAREIGAAALSIRKEAEDRAEGQVW